MTTGRDYGIAFAALVLIGSVWIQMPPHGWKPDGYQPPEMNSGAGGEDFDVAWRKIIHMCFYCTGLAACWAIWVTFSQNERPGPSARRIRIIIRRLYFT